MIKIRNLKKVRIVFLLNLIILLSVFYISNLEPNRMNEDEEIFQDYFSENNLKKAGFWNLTGNPILIDDTDPSKNWSYTASHYDWCSGSGTWTDPYVIENVTIDGQNEGSCILIMDSSKYFILNNNTLYNSGNAGIYLTRTLNGKIIGCNISYNNKHGIDLGNCDNNTLQGNIFSNNTNYAIRVSSSDGNRILNNDMTNNLVGISLGNSFNNNITGNYVSNSEQMGIETKQSSSNNLIFNNSFINNNPNGIDDSSNRLE